MSDNEEWPVCDGPGCKRRLEPSKKRGQPRRWCGDTCRKRAERSAAVETALTDDAGGYVSAATAELVASLEASPGSLLATLGALAQSQAAQVDGGAPAASQQLRLTLVALDEASGLSDRDPDNEFSLFELRFGCLTREGIQPGSRLYRRLLEEGVTKLVSYHPPPSLPEGWRGTAVDGDPGEFAREHGSAWPDVEPLQFWPQAPCERCGYGPGGG